MIQEASFPTHPVEIMKRDSWIDGVFYCSDTIWPGNSMGAYEPSYEYTYILLQYYTVYTNLYWISQKPEIQVSNLTKM